MNTATLLRDPLFWLGVLMVIGLLAAGYAIVRAGVADGMQDYNARRSNK